MDRSEKERQACWFDGVGFGMFIHWDHASQQGFEISWPMVGGVWSLPYGQAVTPAQYQSSAATFNPQAWDAVDLARRARAAEWWRPDEIAALLRELQPGILINDRLPGQGDYITPEQFVPASPPDGRWESCETMNQSWGFNPGDPDIKSSRSLITTLCETAGKGGNLLLNVSPRGDGAPATVCHAGRRARATHARSRRGADHYGAR